MIKFSCPSLHRSLFRTQCPPGGAAAAGALSPVPCSILLILHRLLKGKVHILSMVLELPPAPAALVLVGLAFATLSALSCAAFLLIAVLGPPGGERFLPLLTPAEAGGEVGEDGPGDD